MAKRMSLMVSPEVLANLFKHGTHCFDVRQGIADDARIVDVSMDQYGTVELILESGSYADAPDGVSPAFHPPLLAMTGKCERVEVIH